MQEGSLFSTPSPAFTVCRFFDDGHSNWCEMIVFNIDHRTWQNLSPKYTKIRIQRDCFAGDLKLALIPNALSSCFTGAFLLLLGFHVTFIFSNRKLYFLYFSLFHLSRVILENFIKYQNFSNFILFFPKF